MRYTLILLPIMLLSLCTARARAQGCSDAGVCTAGPIGELQITPDSMGTTDATRHMARLTFSYGAGEQGVVVVQVVPEIAIGITERLGVQVKVPYMNASGNLGANSGVGDPTVSFSYVAHKAKDRRLDLVLGTKINANKADARSADGLSLPMPYQTSLGTTDLLAGVNYRWKRWSAALAYQHVLSNNNANGFSHEAWMDDMDALGYFESAFLQRANDAVVRLQHRIPVSSGLVVQPGALAIVHTGMDSRLEQPRMGPAGPVIGPLERRDIDGSEGLTLNLTIDARWTFAENWALELAYGTPFIVRDSRPDGLTRSMVLNAGLRYGF